MENKGFWFDQYKPVSNKNGESYLINRKTGKRQIHPTVIDYMKDKDRHFKEFYDLRQEQTNAARRSKTYHHYYRAGLQAMGYLFNNLKSIKQVQLVINISQCMNPKTNKYKCTYSSLAKVNHTTNATISRTFKILKRLHFAKFHSSCIFISPKLFMRGPSARYLNIFRDFYYTESAWWKHPNDNDEFTPADKQ